MQTKRDLSERDICTKYIIPALQKAGWNIEKQIREEVYFTDGKIYIKGNKTKRGTRKRADYILYYKPNIPVAIIEAKRNEKSIGFGIQQALEYAEILDIPVAYSSNGDGFLEHDKTVFLGKIERQLELTNFPSPQALWERYKKYKGIYEKKQEKIISQDYFYDRFGYKLRYYQQIAINRTVESIAKGEKRILLVMATGTGKTYTAFQIIYRLWKNRIKKRILFLADRNALIDQTKRGDFKPFKDHMTVIRKKKIDKAYEIYLALYQGLTNYNEDKDAYREFSPDFFDLIIVDECHRGSAAADSAWREILEYFHSATQIGMTATPKETKQVSNIEYFGEPVYTYSLTQGIEDGFLAPYKVIRVGINIEIEGWRPERGKTDEKGKQVKDKKFIDYTEKKIIDACKISEQEIPKKVFVTGVYVSILNERIQYLDNNGKLITESLREYTKRNLLKKFRTLDNFLTKWNNSEKKRAIIEELEKNGIILDNLKVEIEKDMDIFDLICHVAWDKPALSRKERAENVRKRNYFAKYEDKAKKVINALLDKYADEGIKNIEDLSILKIEPFTNFGTPLEIIRTFGGKNRYLKTIKEMERYIYEVA